MSVVKKRPLSQAIAGEAPQAIIIGTSGDDTLIGTSGDDEIRGLEGNDYLSGGNHTNEGAGNDFLDGGPGDDEMWGGYGNDTYIIDSSNDQANDYPGRGFDSVYTSATYAARQGSEIEVLAILDQAGTAQINLYGDRYNNFIWGNQGANFLYGGGGDDVLDAFGGDDALNGGGGADYLSGGDGNDSLVSGDGYADTLVGGNGNDVLDGRVNQAHGMIGAKDTLIGGPGDDTYFVDIDEDLIIETAGQGFDIVYTTRSNTIGEGVEIEIFAAIGNNSVELRGNSAGNTIWGNGNALNTLIGLGGNDVLMGLDGGDMLIGGEGNDYLDGGTGFGQQFGGAGADTFAFSTMNGYATIEDFAGGTDKLLLYSNVFTGLAPGALPASAFVVGTAFLDADDRILYNPANGQLSYDADGTGGAFASVQIASMQPGFPGLVLAASDFVVY